MEVWGSANPTRSSQSGETHRRRDRDTKRNRRDGSCNSLIRRRFLGAITCGHDMDEYCMVMAGDWVCGKDGKWNFFVDKQRCLAWSRSLGSVALSYWPPSTIELATGIMTPPVLLTNDGAVGYFSRHMKSKFPRGLEGEWLPHTSAAIKRKMFDDVWSSGKGGYVSSAASKFNAVVVEEDELIREVEKVEEKIRDDSLRSNEGEPSKTIDSDSSLADEVDDRDVRPRGYDKEFWAPFIREDNSGSDVVGKVLNAEDSNPRTYRCTTNNAFDHTVVTGGPSSSNASSGACILCRWLVSFGVQSAVRVAWGQLFVFLYSRLCFVFCVLCLV
ncbi:hypothetical protein Bca4012_071782 [Brassica carinata]